MTPTPTAGEGPPGPAGAAPPPAGGTGARGGSPAAVAFQTSVLPSPISAFCLAGSEGCPDEGSCSDGNPCTEDGRSSEGLCENTVFPDGTQCALGAYPGQCEGGVCLLNQVLCDDQNQCTRDISLQSGCRFEAVEDGTPCIVANEEGFCSEGICTSPG